jgi:hypothetical protein
MKRELIATLRAIDKFCARLNSGLAAVVVVLGLITLCLAVARLPELPPEPLGISISNDSSTLADAAIQYPRYNKPSNVDIGAW